MGSDQIDRNTWLAVGEKAGVHAILWGAEYTAGELVNIRHNNWKYEFGITGLRIGPGIGAGAGYVLVFLFNCVSPNQLHQTKVADWGLNLSVGGKLDDVAMALKNLKLFSAIGKVGKAAAYGVKNADKIRDAAHTIYTGLEISKNSFQPSVVCLDTPIGVGGEVSLFNVYGTFRVTGNTSVNKF